MKTDHEKEALICPEAYEGTVPNPDVPGGEESIIDRATFLGLPPLLERRGLWVLTKEGIYSLHDRWEISIHELDKRDWKTLVSKKGWVNMTDFATIFDLAKEMIEFGVI